jgi:cytochrome c oxidase subunit IV
MSDHVSTSNSAAAVAHDAHAEHVAHVNPWVVFVVLAIMTLVEIVLALPQVGIKPSSLAPLLVAMALVKAALVALYYMHLRYEKPLYLLIFITPTLFAVLLTVVLMSNI